MPIGFTPPEYPKDLIHITRWMCSNCGLIFDFAPYSAPDELGWPSFDPPLEQDFGWIDKDGVFHEDETEHKEICPRCSCSLDEKPLLRVIVSKIKLLKDVKPVIEQGEGQTLEFMEISPKDGNEFAKEVAAFSMSEGGMIFLGINDDGEIVGLKGVDTPDGKDKLVKEVRSRVGTINPKIEVSIDFVSDGDTNIALIAVPMGSRPCYSIRGVTYIRYLDESRKIEGEELTKVIEKRISKKH